VVWQQRLDYWQKQLTVADSPDRRAEIYLRAVTSLNKLEQFDQAKAFCRKGLEQKATGPKVVELLNLRAWELATGTDLRFRDAGLAVELAQRGVELDAKDGNMRNTLSVARYRAGDYTGATADLQKSIQLDKGGNSFDFFVLAMAHQRLGDSQAARQSYDKGVQWMDQKAAKNEDLARFRAEAEETLFGKRGAPTTAPATASAVAASRPAN
jgi:tetratricopeptide (TPR) repeat protein